MIWYNVNGQMCPTSPIRHFLFERDINVAHALGCVFLAAFFGPMMSTALSRRERSIHVVFTVFFTSFLCNAEPWLAHSEAAGHPKSHGAAVLPGSSKEHRRGGQAQVPVLGHSARAEAK